MGVALTPCIVPEAGKATFSIAEDEMEIGMGIHGEPGIHQIKLMLKLMMLLVILWKKSLKIYHLKMVVKLLF